VCVCVCVCVCVRERERERQRDVEREGGRVGRTTVRGGRWVRVNVIMLCTPAEITPPASPNNSNGIRHQLFFLVSWVFDSRAGERLIQYLLDYFPFLGDQRLPPLAYLALACDESVTDSDTFPLSRPAMPPPPCRMRAVYLKLYCDTHTHTHTPYASID
jgi:hypothetical protein